MPDISMCANQVCPLFQKCYRAQAEPNPWRQSYSEFKPNENGECDYFSPIEPGDRLRKENLNVT